MIETITVIVLVFFIKVLSQWLFPPMTYWSDLVISTGNVKILNPCHLDPSPSLISLLDQ